MTEFFPAAYRHDNLLHVSIYPRQNEIPLRWKIVGISDSPTTPRADVLLIPNKACLTLTPGLQSI